jgi:hypothetical protein
VVYVLPAGGGKSSAPSAQLGLMKLSWNDLGLKIRSRAVICVAMTGSSRGKSGVPASLHNLCTNPFFYR